MFKTLTPLLCLTLLCCLNHGALAQDVQETRNQWENAIASGDPSRLDSLLADNFSAILENGQQLDSTAFQRLLANGHPGLTGAAGTVDDLRTFDGVVLANGVLSSEQKETTTEWVRETRRSTGRVIMREVETEGLVEVRLRYTEVWLKIDQRWQLAALQLTGEQRP